MSNRQIEIEATDRVDDLRYEPVSQKYRSVQIANAVMAYALLAVVFLLLLLIKGSWWCVIAEAVVIIAAIINLAILSKAYRYKGYALREHDISYRSGVIFPKVTTVPYSRIQQVSISQSPVAKYFGLYAISVVNGAQGMSSLVIHGLTKEKAEGIKSVVTQRLDRGND